MINTLKQPLRTLGYSTGVQQVDLYPGVNIHAIRGRLTATVTISGGTTSGTVRTEGVQRFLKSLRVAWDGVNIVEPISGRDLYQYNLISNAQIVAATNLANGNAAATNVAFDFVIPFARPWLAKPIDTVWPGIVPVNQELTIYVEFETSTAETGDSAGSAAFLQSDGDRATAITNVALSFVQEYSTKRYMPWFLPFITVRETQQYVAAMSELPLNLRGLQRFDSVMISDIVATTADAADLVNYVTLLSSGGATRYFDRVPWLALQRDALGMFPALSTGGQTGRAFLNFAGGGLLGNAADPRNQPDPRFLFDVASPTGSVGTIRGVFNELRVDPRYTKVKD